MGQDGCKVIYLDRRARNEQTWTHESLVKLPNVGSGPSASPNKQSGQDEVEQNVRSLLSVFPQVTVYKSSTPCVSEVDAYCKDRSSPSCMILVVEIPPAEESASRYPRLETQSSSPTRSWPRTVDSWQSENLYGMDFLTHISYVVRTEDKESHIIPVALLSNFDPSNTTKKPYMTDPSLHAPASHTSIASGSLHARYFETGAVDVITSPFSVDRIQGLPAHAHRLSIERDRRSLPTYLPTQGRRPSWVGTGEGKSYTHLKDKMVCELMEHIVNPDREELPIDPSVLSISSARHAEIAATFGSWSFSAHDYNDDELLYGAFLALQHTLGMPELSKWRIGRDELITFFLATRRVYNSSVLYHNFRHACDVFQATFCFLLRIGAIPPFSNAKPKFDLALTPLGTLVDPFHAMVLLISAIGHDVGHPGVNNGFLVTVKAPLAQLYNDRSVLESFHCAAYSQLLRRYWKPVFEDSSIRRLIIKAILATDMGLHTDYMMQMEALQKKCPQTVEQLSGWTGLEKQDTRDLLLCLLIKCADICNVARKFDVASHWAKILIDEFFAQGQIEKDLNVETALFGGPPDPDSLLQKCKSQIGFMNVFAYPLFGGIAKLLPTLVFAVEEIDRNKGIWEDTIKIETGQPSGQAPLRSAKIGTHFSVDADGHGKVHVGHLENVDTSTRVSVQLTAAMNSQATYHNSRRASGGTATGLLSIRDHDPEARRSSLGPTVIPDPVRTRKRSSLHHFNDMYTTAADR